MQGTFIIMLGSIGLPCVQRTDEKALNFISEGLDALKIYLLKINKENNE